MHLINIQEQTEQAPTSQQALTFVYSLFQSKRLTSQTKTRSHEGKLPVEKASDNPAQQLASSVDSFANYLKQFVRPVDSQESQPPPVRWSSDEPTRSVVRGLSSEARRLSQEKALQEEVSNWQMAWKDERRRNDKLLTELAAREKENSIKEEKSRLAYQQQIHDLQQDVLVLQSRLRSQEEEADVKQRVLCGASLQVIKDKLLLSNHRSYV